MQKDKFKQIAEYMIAEGCELTQGNWIFSFDEINSEFGVNLPDDSNLINNIAEYICAEKSEIFFRPRSVTGLRFGFLYRLLPEHRRVMLGRNGNGVSYNE